MPSPSELFLEFPLVSRVESKGSKADEMHIIEISLNINTSFLLPASTSLEAGVELDVTTAVTQRVMDIHGRQYQNFNRFAAQCPSEWRDLLEQLDSKRMECEGMRHLKIPKKRTR